MSARAGRRQTKYIQILLTPEEYARFEEKRGSGTMRSLVVRSVLGEPLEERVARLEDAIEDVVAELARSRVELLR
jgi:hypothetical protein